MNTIKLIAETIQRLDKLGFKQGSVRIGPHHGNFDYMEIILTGYWNGYQKFQVASAVSNEENYDGFADGLIMALQAFERTAAAKRDNK